MIKWLQKRLSCMHGSLSCIVPWLEPVRDPSPSHKVFQRTSYSCSIVLISISYFRSHIRYRLLPPHVYIHFAFPILTFPDRISSSDIHTHFAYSDSELFRLLLL